MEQNPNSSKVDRKTIEKNRRNYMKGLVTKLTSLVPERSGDVLTLPDQLQEATNYIKKLQAKLEKSKERRDGVITGGSSSAGGGRSSSSNEDTMGLCMNILPKIEIHEKDSIIEVILMTGLDCKFMLKEIISVIQEEGAEVLNATFSLVDNSTLYQTIHSKIGDCEPHYAAARISERVNKILYG